jgi:hypothetical protein
MQQNKSKQLKYSELLAVWTDFGLSREWQSRSLPAVIVKEQGDALAGTTQELMDVSIRCELDGESYTRPTPACKWCSLETIESDKYWKYGHRQGWWVCSQCKCVYPCRHESLDDVDEFNLTGTCSTCGFRLPCSFVAEHLFKKYKEKAEHFRVNAELIREHELQCREQEKLWMEAHDDDEVTYVKCHMPFNDSRGK